MSPEFCDFLSAFKELAKSTDNIVCIVLSKVLSATHDAAIQAKETLKSEHPKLNIEIVDSKHSVGALGFIVLEAAMPSAASLPLVVNLRGANSEFASQGVFLTHLLCIFTVPIWLGIFLNISGFYF